MFKFGYAPILDLEDAKQFAQQFQLEEERPTLRHITEPVLYVITIWCSVWTLQASLSDRRTILMCSMRLYLLRMAINAAVLIQ